MIAYSKNRALQGAYMKGRRAARDHRRREAPYPDLKTFRGNRVSWSRAFRSAWLKGFDDETAQPSETGGLL